MRQLILVVIAVLVFSPVGIDAMEAETSAVLDEIRKSAHRKAIITGVRLSVEQEKEALPRKIDEITTLKNVEFEETASVSYYYTLNLTKSQVEKGGAAKLDQFKAFSQRALVEQVCSEVFMQPFLNLGGLYRYSYSTLDGLFLVEVTVERSDCAQRRR